MSDREQLIRDLRAAWCESLSFFDGPDGSLYLATPFLHGDGDVFPVVLEPAGQSWRFTDRGQALAHLAVEDFDMTERLEQIARRIAESAGLHPRNDLVLEGPILDDPTPYDLADFLSAIAQMEALPLVRKRSEREAFVKAIQENVRRWVPAANYEDHWSSQYDPQGLFATDAKLITNEGSDVYLWVAGDAEKAERAANNIHQFHRWGLTGPSVIGIRSDVVKSRTFGRIAEMVGGDAVVSMASGESAVLRERLADLRVPVAA